MYNADVQPAYQPQKTLITKDKILMDFRKHHRKYITKKDMSTGATIFLLGCYFGSFLLGLILLIGFAIFIACRLFFLNRNFREMEKDVDSGYLEVLECHLVSFENDENPHIQHWEFSINHKEKVIKDTVWVEIKDTWHIPKHIYDKYYLVVLHHEGKDGVGTTCFIPYHADNCTFSSDITKM